MIKSNITAYMGTYTFDGEIIVPSMVLTSNPQEEEFDLSYTPNFTIKLNDAYSYLNDTVELSFSYGNNEYTAYANVINRSAGVTTLQYSYGLTTTYVEPTPVVHTLELDQTDLYTSRDNYTNEAVTSNRLYAYFDNEVLEGRLLVGGSITYANRGTHAGGWIDYTAKENLEVGEYTETAEFTYNGLTAYCNVHTTITDSTPEGGPQFSSPADGDTITGTIDLDAGEFTYPIEVVDANGNNISYDITSMCVTCDNQDVNIGYTEDYDEQTQSTYITSVYLTIYQAGSGTATLTFDDGEQSCTATFTYDISEGHTLSFSESEYYTYYDKHTDTTTHSQKCELIYDGNTLGSPYNYFDKNVHSYDYNDMQVGGDSATNQTWYPKTDSLSLEPGVYTDTVVATVDGTSTQCNVILTITDEAQELDDYTLSSAPSSYSDISAYYDSVVYSNESNDVYMTSVGMTYDTDHYLFDAANQTDYVLRIWAPSNNTIDKITFVGLNEPYASALLQQGTVGHGTITDDGNGNTIWTRTQDYNTYEGLEEFGFTPIIGMYGTSMTCNEIIISLNPNYIPPEMKITFTTSQGTYQIWNNFTAGGGYGETVMYDLASDTQGSDMIHGTWKYYIDDVEQDSNTYFIQSDGNMPFNDGGIYINTSTDNDGNVHSITSSIGYLGPVYYVTLDSNVTINYQMALV